MVDVSAVQDELAADMKGGQRTIMVCEAFRKVIQKRPFPLSFAFLNLQLEQKLQAVNKVTIVTPSRLSHSPALLHSQPHQLPLPSTPLR